MPYIKGTVNWGDFGQRGDFGQNFAFQIRNLSLSIHFIAFGKLSFKSIIQMYSIV